MKRISYILSAFMLLAVFSGCYIDFDSFCVRGEGGIRSEERILRSFTKIDIQNDADVYLRMDKGQEVIVEAQENILDELETYVRGDILYIDYDKCVNNHDGLNIYITLPFVDGLKVSGTGNLYGDGPIDAENIEIKISGSGNIELDDLVSKYIRSHISGSGDIYLAGPHTVGRHELLISGSGYIKSNNLPVDYVSVDITGSGTCWVHAISDLKVDIYGSGDVYYIGEPVITENIQGSGRVKKDY